MNNVLRDPVELSIGLADEYVIPSGTLRGEVIVVVRSDLTAGMQYRRIRLELVGEEHNGVRDDQGEFDALLDGYTANRTYLSRHVTLSGVKSRTEDAETQLQLRQEVMYGKHRDVPYTRVVPEKPKKVKEALAKQAAAMAASNAKSNQREAAANAPRGAARAPRSADEENVKDDNPYSRAEAAEMDTSDTLIQLIHPQEPLHEGNRHDAHEDSVIHHGERRLVQQQRAKNARRTSSPGSKTSTTRQMTVNGVELDAAEREGAQYEPHLSVRDGRAGASATGGAHPVHREADAIHTDAHHADETNRRPGGLERGVTARPDLPHSATATSDTPRTTTDEPRATHGAEDDNTHTALDRLLAHATQKNPRLDGTNTNLNQNTHGGSAEPAFGGAIPASGAGNEGIGMAIGGGREEYNHTGEGETIGRHAERLTAAVEKVVRRGGGAGHAATRSDKENVFNTPTQTLQPGRYAFPFSFRVPPWLPPSLYYAVSDASGYIHYYAKVVIEFAGIRQDMVVRKPFYVLSAISRRQLLACHQEAVRNLSVAPLPPLSAQFQVFSCSCLGNLCCLSDNSAIEVEVLLQSSRALVLADANATYRIFRDYHRTRWEHDMGLITNTAPNGNNNNNASSAEDKKETKEKRAQLKQVEEELKDHVLNGYDAFAERRRELEAYQPQVKAGAVNPREVRLKLHKRKSHKKRGGAEHSATSSSYVHSDDDDDDDESCNCSCSSDTSSTGGGNEEERAARRAQKAAMEQQRAIVEAALPLPIGVLPLLVRVVNRCTRREISTVRVELREDVQIFKSLEKPRVLHQALARYDYTVAIPPGDEATFPARLTLPRQFRRCKEDDPGLLPPPGVRTANMATSTLIVVSFPGMSTYVEEEDWASGAIQIAEAVDETDEVLDLPIRYS